MSGEQQWSSLAQHWSRAWGRNGLHFTSHAEHKVEFTHAIVLPFCKCVKLAEVIWHTEQVVQCPHLGRGRVGEGGHQHYSLGQTYSAPIVCVCVCVCTVFGKYWEPRPGNLSNSIAFLMSLTNLLTVLNHIREVGWVGGRGQGPHHPSTSCSRLLAFVHIHPFKMWGLARKTSWSHSACVDDTDRNWTWVRWKCLFSNKKQPEPRSSPKKDTKHPEPLQLLLPILHTGLQRQVTTIH